MPIPQPAAECTHKRVAEGRRKLGLQADANTGISGGSLFPTSKQIETSRKQVQARHLGSASGIATE